MSAQRFVVVADSEDEKARKRERPVFEIGEKPYFHGDVFEPPAGWELSMDGFQGRGLRFVYTETYRNDEGKTVSIPHAMILPLAEGAVENIVETPPPQVQRKPKTPKAV